MDAARATVTLKQKAGAKGGRVHQFPAFRLYGKCFVWFGAAANHCAIYGLLGDHKDELKDYDISKGKIRFQADDGETDWLKRALAAACAQRLDLSAFAKPGSTDPVQDFLDAHYSVRCAAFHSKSSFGHALRSGSLGDHGVVLQQLLAVQTLV